MGQIADVVLTCHLRCPRSKWEHLHLQWVHGSLSTWVPAIHVEGPVWVLGLQIPPVYCLFKHTMISHLVRCKSYLAICFLSAPYILNYLRDRRMDTDKDKKIPICWVTHQMSKVGRGPGWSQRLGSHCRSSIWGVVPPWKRLGEAELGAKPRHSDMGCG